ncbi:hypothetical protein [Rhizobium tubonense]|uniref:ATP-dependent DNA ligase family profile domain-containing protein n=1 Tax=Rhizobium tubonense TaxID=484088 RepID=A0A2W4CHB4_9HYPH|nr:hypothetical protein CPY51_23175 [Rhizobium tubonense]
MNITIAVTRIDRPNQDYFDRKAAKAFAVATAILDGEAIVLDDEARSDFSALLSLGGRGGKQPSNEAVFYVIDLLYFDGHGQPGMEQTERRHLLEDFLEEEAGIIRLSEHVEAGGGVLRVPASTASKASSPNTEAVRIQSYEGWPAIATLLTCLIAELGKMFRDARCSLCEEMPARGDDGVIGNDPFSPASMSLIFTLHHPTKMSVCAKSLPLNSSGMR